MHDGNGVQGELDPRTRAFYRHVMETLNGSKIPFLVGGAYALARHAGVERHTKDLDVFVRPEDAARTLAVLAGAGYHTELTFPHWLGKAFSHDAFIDVIFSSGNGVARVDDRWFDHAVESEVLGVPVRLCPPEETLWSKAFVLERERYDGADIAHLLRSCGRGLDWARLLERFGPHWRVLLSHLVLFGFIYPGERSRVPDWVMDHLLDRLREEGKDAPPEERLCQGTLLSRTQYLPDVEQWGYKDARAQPGGTMTRGEITHWTEAATDQPAPTQPAPSP